MAQPEPRVVRRRWRARRRFWWFLGLTALALVLAAGAGAGWFLATIQVPGAHDDSTGTVTAMGRPDERINVLLMGHDVEQVRNGRRQPTRTDTIMVASFDPLTHEVDLLSIPRDTRVEIPGHQGYDKINAAHAYGGPDLTLETVNRFLGVSIPYYVDIGVEGFQKIVDELGGVDVYVPFNMNYDDPVQDLHIHLKKGQQHLNGYQAMGFVRDRYDDPRNDFGRIERQHAFLAAMAKKVLAPSSWVHFPQLIGTLAQYVRTTLDTKTMITLERIGHDAGPDGLIGATLPTRDLNLNGVSYQTIDPQTVKEYVDRYVRGIDPERNRTVRVRVLNGTGVSGLAAQMAAYLKGLGYDVVQVGNAASQNHASTAVYVQNSAEVAGKVLVRTLHGTWPEIDEPFTADSLDARDRVMPATSEGASSEGGTSEASGASESRAAGPGWDVTVVVGSDVASSGVPSEAPPSTDSEGSR